MDDRGVTQAEAVGTIPAGSDVKGDRPWPGSTGNIHIAHEWPTCSGGVDIGCERPDAVARPSRRTAAVGMQFGLSGVGSRLTIVGPAWFPIEPGRIVAFVGPSGGGKTTALTQVEHRFPDACRVERVVFPPDAAVVDGVASGASLSEALAILTACGLAEARLWIRPFAVLSDGEKFRARLARAIAFQGRHADAGLLLCDEFCSTLHRRAARAISYNLRKLVGRRRFTLIVACSNDDILGDLQPDTIVWMKGGGVCETEHRTVRGGRPPSFRRRLRIEPGSKRDYDAFAPMHYRATDELGFVDRVFILRDGRGGEAVGIVVYSHAPLELALRNRATNGQFSRNADRVNRSLRILRRLVIHPDLRGCGLGHYLVRKTLPLVGTEYVECLASMGEFNPVFEKAGMRRIGQCEIPPSCRTAIEALRAMDVDPSSRDFPTLVGRRRRVREIVMRVARDWYAATTGEGKGRVDHQSPAWLAQIFRGLMGSRPVYYLWRRGRPTQARVNGPGRGLV